MLPILATIFIRLDRKYQGNKFDKDSTKKFYDTIAKCNLNVLSMHKWSIFYAYTQNIDHLYTERTKWWSGGEINSWLKIENGIAVQKSSLCGEFNSFTLYSSRKKEILNFSELIN